jgi:hypothetical protein
MKLVIGLVVKGGNEFIDKWIKSAEEICDNWFIIDNDADVEVREKLLNHKNTKRYLYQPGLEKNMSRDYQKILDFAREDNYDWIWNLDIDEIIDLTISKTKITKKMFLDYLINVKDESIGLPLFEMRNDLKHYVMVTEYDNTLKHARLCHKIYKNLSHFKFNEKDKHGQSIPHNCRQGGLFMIFILHLGHMTKELRDKKRKEYKENEIKNSDLKDMIEIKYTTWFEEDESKITINNLEGFGEKWGL